MSEKENKKIDPPSNAQKTEVHNQKVPAESHKPAENKAQKGENKTQDEKMIEEQIRKMIGSMNQNITESEIKEYIHHELPLKRPITQENFKEWEGSRKQIAEQTSKQSEKQIQSDKDHANQKKEIKAEDKMQAKKEEKHEEKKQENKDSHKEDKKGVKKEQKKEEKKVQKKEEEKQKKHQPKQQQKKQLSPQQLCQQFFAQPGENKQIKSKFLFALNGIVHSKLPITHDILNRYLKNGAQKHNVAEFSQWIIKQEDSSFQSIEKQFKESQGYFAFEGFQKKLEEIIGLADSNKSTLNLNLGIGQSKGKTTLKYVAELRESKQENFTLFFDIRIKKKLELRTMIQNELKKVYKSNDFHILKLCKLQFSETEKSLRIHLVSKFLEQTLFKELVQKINAKFMQEQKPVLKLEGQLITKSSLKADQSQLANKKFIKWLAEGATKKMHIEGNHKVIQHFTSPLIDVFPIFKAVRSGQVNLKFKNIQSVDKLFDKLGINDICEETPNVHDYINEITSEYLGMLPLAGDLLRRCMFFACSIPNQKIGCEVSATLSHLHLSLTIGSEACKELGEILSKSLIEHFG